MQHNMAIRNEAHPWLQPFGRRIGVTIFCALWFGFESWSQPGSIWFWMALCVLGWAVWDFFLSGNYAEKAKDDAPHDD